jgi:hypothetical protein
VYLCDKRAVDRDQVLSCRSRSGTDPPVTVHVRLAAGGLTRPGRRNGTPICPRGGGRMEPSGKDGRGGEVSLAAPGHDGMPVRSRPTTALAIWSSVLQPGSLSAGRQQGEHDRRRACRINTRAPRDKQNSRMPRWQARTSGECLHEDAHLGRLCQHQGRLAQHRLGDQQTAMATSRAALLRS